MKNARTTCLASNLWHTLRAPALLLTLTVLTLGSRTLAAPIDQLSLTDAGELSGIFSTESSAGLDQVTLTSGTLVFANPSGGDTSGTAPSVSLVSSSSLGAFSDIVLSFDSLQWKSRANPAAARFNVGLGKTLAVGVTPSGTGGVLYYNNTEYPLAANPIAEGGSVAMSVRYIAAEKRVVVLQTSGSYRDAAGTAYAAPAYGVKLYDSGTTYAAAIATSTAAPLIISAQTQGNGGFDTGVTTEIGNVSVYTNLMVFDDPADNKDKWEAVSTNKAGWDFFNPVEVGGDNRFVFTLANATPNVALGTKRVFQAGRAVEFSFDNFYYRTGSNPNQQGIRIGLNTPQATNLAMLSIKLTQSGISSALFYNNTEYALANRPVPGDMSNGKMALKVSYSDGGRVKITQLAGSYLPEGSSTPTPVPAGGIVLYDAMPTGVPLSFPVGTHFRMTTGVSGNGGFVADPPATIDNLRLVGRAGGSMSWPDEAQRGINVGTWLTSSDLAPLRAWGTKVIRAQLVGSLFTPEDSGGGNWTFPAGGWTALDNFLAAAKANGLKVIIDFHERTSIFPNGAYATWSQETGAAGIANKDKLVSLWKNIATYYKNERGVIAAYEILNEPNAGETPGVSRTKANDVAPLDGADALNAIYTEVIAAIRAIDRYHNIIIEPVGYANQSYLPRLKYFDPAATPGIIYSVHMYSPHEFTEQGSTIEPKWTFGFDGVSGYYYPGVFNRLTNYSPVEYTPMLLDKDYIINSLAPIVEFQSAHKDARIHVGEFSSKRWAPVNLDGQDSTWTFLRDCYQLFYNTSDPDVKYPHWDWTVHAFRMGGLEGYTGLENSNIKEDAATAPRYTDTNKIRLYKHYMQPENDAVAPPAYITTLPDAQIPATVPAAPYGLASNSLGEGRIALAWVSTSRTTDYKIKRATTAGGPYEDVATVPATTDTTMEFTDTDLENNTVYYYVVTAINASGEGAASSETHATATNIPQPPKITTQPATQSTPNGTQATLSVIVSGTAPVTYQWYKDGTLVSSATTASLALTGTPVDSGNYWVVITGTNGMSATSGTATVTITPADNSPFPSPAALTMDAIGDLYVVDSTLHVMQTITGSGGMYVYVGASGTAGNYDNTAKLAKFNKPSGISVRSGNIYVADAGNNSIRAVDDYMAVTTLFSSTVAGQRLSNPTGITTDAAGNIYIADKGNHVIRKIAAGATETTVIAGVSGTAGATDASGTSARFNSPSGIAFQASGSAAPGNFLYVADTGNNTIRKIALDSGAAVTTLAGTHDLPGSLDGTGTLALFNEPEGIFVDGAGIVYVADTGNSTIREITSAGAVITIAGNPGEDGLAGIAGFRDGTGTNAWFNHPKGVALSNDGHYLYIADTGNRAIRMIDAQDKVTTPVYTTGTAPVPRVNTEYDVTYRTETGVGGGGGGAPGAWYFAALGVFIFAHIIRSRKKSRD